MQTKWPKKGSAIYVLPNVLTTGSLFFGFFSIVKCLQGDFGWAASAILLSAIFDVLDGRVARLTRATSEFGVQYDSLCDLVSFGVAPSFLMYQFALGDLGRVGWIACFLFLACGALRLARFNVQSSVGKTAGDFTGLPIPMAAFVVATFVLLTIDLAKAPEARFWVLTFLTELLNGKESHAKFFIVTGPALAMMMVSNIHYRSHKSLKITRVKPFRILSGLVILVGLVAYQPELLGFLFAITYALSGPFEYVIGWKKAADDDDYFETTDVLESGSESELGELGVRPIELKSRSRAEIGVSEGDSN